MKFWSRLVICAHIVRIAVCLLLGGCATTSPAHHLDTPIVSMDLMQSEAARKATLKELAEAQHDVNTLAGEMTRAQNEADAKAHERDVEQAARLALEAKQAGIERNVLYGMAGLGALAILLGPLVWWKIGANLGKGMIAGGLLLLASVLVMRRILPAIEYAVDATLAVIVIGIAFAAAMKLWVWWQSNIMAKRKLVDAGLLEMQGCHHEAMAQREAAKSLEFVGSKNWKAKKRKAA